MIVLTDVNVSALLSISPKSLPFYYRQNAANILWNVSAITGGKSFMSGVSDDANSVAELTRALLTSCASKQTAATTTQTVS